MISSIAQYHKPVNSNTLVCKTYAGGKSDSLPKIMESE